MNINQVDQVRRYILRSRGEEAVTTQLFRTPSGFGLTLKGMGISISTESQDEAGAVVREILAARNRMFPAQIRIANGNKTYR